MNKIQIIHKAMWKTSLCGLLGALFLVLGAGLPALSLEKMAPDTDVQANAPEVNSKDSLAGQAGDDFKGGTKSLGNGFKNGAKATGGAFKKAGVTMGRAFKKAGVAIKEFFAGKKDASVEERDLSETSEPGGEAKPEPVTYDRNLDAVGDS